MPFAQIIMLDLSCNISGIALACPLYISVHENICCDIFWKCHNKMFLVEKVKDI